MTTIRRIGALLADLDRDDRAEIVGDFAAMIEDGTWQPSEDEVEFLQGLVNELDASDEDRGQLERELGRELTEGEHTALSIELAGQYAKDGLVDGRAALDALVDRGDIRLYDLDDDNDRDDYAAAIVRDVWADQAAERELDEERPPNPYADEPDTVAATEQVIADAHAESRAMEDAA